MSAAFEREFTVHKSVRVRMDTAYRQCHRDLCEQGAGEWQPASASAAATYKRLNSDIRVLRDLSTQQDMQGRNTLLAGLVHMHLNRCFCKAQRKQELMVYYFLWKSYHHRVQEK
ncbi:hypothetical protein INP83_10900 [Mucilaginibacter sp. 21P]|nr:hypothetical protein INP83_10900 [Mucilaginibacter sp. 21P]